MDLLYKGTDLKKRGASLPSALWEATRPRMFPVWVSSAAVPATVAALCGVFEPLTCVLEALLCFALLTLSCWADEVGDLDHGVDNEARLGPHRPLQRGEITRKQLLIACVALACFCGALGLGLLVWSFHRIPVEPWVPWAFIGMGAFAILCAFAYTMGKRPYGYHGWGDLAAYFFFGPVACLGGVWLYGHTFVWPVLLPATSIGLLLVVTINLQNIRDFENDAANGKRTTAVCLGYIGAVIYHYVITVIALLCYVAFPIVWGMTNPLHYLFVLAFAPLIAHLVKFRATIRTGNPKRLDLLMWPLCRGMLIACLAWCVCMLLPL